MERGLEWALSRSVEQTIRGLVTITVAEGDFGVCCTYKCRGEVNAALRCV